jgi:hypothetical protein
MVYEARQAQADQTPEIVGQGVAILGAAEDGPIAGKRVAAEGTGPAAQSQIELLSRHRVFEPASFEVQHRQVASTSLHNHGTADSDRARVQSSSGVYPVGQAIEISETAGQTHPDAAAYCGTQSVTVVTE